MNTELDNSIIENSFIKMDILIAKLQKYINTSHTNTAVCNKYQSLAEGSSPQVLQESSKIPLHESLEKSLKNSLEPESPEYYKNEINNFLIDNCKEKDKRIILINKILNISIMANVILLAYILGIHYYGE
jgi:hypothetical protein